jgi:HTH-type transcriptional regulator, quorum sensing regulator NprR
MTSGSGGDVEDLTAHGPNGKSQIDVLAADVGQRIRAARKARGMSLADVGRDDLTRSFLSLVELGRSRISLRALSIVASRLDLPISYFLEDAPGTREGGVELTLDAAESDVIRGKPDAALEKLENLEVSASLLPRIQLIRGRALIAVDASREAVAALREGLTAAKQRDDAAMTPYLHHEMGRALYATGNYDEALGHFRDALDASAGDAQDPTLVGRITIGIGHILYIRGDSQGAIEHYERARDLFRQVSDLNTLGAVYSGLSLAYNRKGDAGNALRYSRLSVAAYTAHQNEQQAARELNNLAVRYQELDDLRSALECGAEAVARAQMVKARDVEAVAHSTLASVHLRLDEFDEARTEARMAEGMARNDDDIARIDAWIVQAKIAEHDGDTERADDLYVRALMALDRAGCHTAYADTALGYSLVLRQRGETERALEYAVQAAQTKAARAT